MKNPIIKGKKLRKLSKEHRKKISEAKKGIKFSEEHRRNLSEAKKGKYMGEENPNWKGDDGGYVSHHRWLKDNFGKANKCENEECCYPRKNRARKKLIAPKGFEWALLKGKQHGHNRENYIQLCPSCHRKYDLNI